MQSVHPKHTRQRRTDLTSGRKFNADELQLMLLQLLSDAPAHGYELIMRLKNLSQDYYSPSPGVVYPALAQLETLAFTDVETMGRRKKYHLTQTGQAHLEKNTAQVNELFSILKHAAKKMLWLKHANDNTVVATETTGWIPEYVAARQALHSALLALDDICPSEQQRIANVLQHAAKKILKKTQ